MQVGDLIYDMSAKGYGIIVELYPSWTNTSGQTHYWDFRIFSDGQVFFVDSDEVEEVK